MRVSENIRYGLEVSRIPRDVMQAKTREVMKLMGLEALGERYPHELSGGQQQRVAVARALVLEPMVLLFDEPLSNLDAKLRRRVRQEIRDLQQSLKLTVIYVTHDQEEALAVSDTIVVMNNAVVAQMGSPRELHERPTSRFVADFIGEANVLPCQILDSGPDGTRVQLGSLQLTLEGQTTRRGAGHVAIRPGRIALHAQTAGVQTALLAATLAKSSYLGEYFEHMVQTELGEVLVASSNTTEQLSPGQALGLGFSPDTVVLLQD
jgi:iron(III) transport system ATP-binding protein